MPKSTRQPRLNLGEWVIDNQMETLCQVRYRAQSPDKHHWVTVYAPRTATWFTTRESDFRKLSPHQVRVILAELRKQKALAWEKVLRPTKPKQESEKQQNA